MKQEPTTINSARAIAGSGRGCGGFKGYMKAHDNGCFYSVSVSRDEVEAFKDKWPCSHLPSRSIWFQFDKRNGDLVDMKPSNLEERGADGSAVLALSQDAQAYGKRKLALMAT